MVNKAEGSLDETILQIFEEQEESFYWPVRSQKDARAFVKALNVKGVKYEDVCTEIEEFSSNFTAWRKGLGRIGIGNRVIERINRPLQEVLESDDEDDVMEKVKKFKAKQANGGGQKPPSPELEARLHSTKAEVTKEQKKGIEDSWMKNIEKKTEVLKKGGDAIGNDEKVASSSTTRSSSSSSSAASSSGSLSGTSSGTSSSSSSVEREIKPQLRSSEERTESVLRKMENRTSWVEREKEAAVFARTVASKDEKSGGKAVVEQANMKPSDILKRQSPRSMSPASEKSATPSREQSPLVERANIPKTKTLETKSETKVETKVEKKVEDTKKQETSKLVEKSKAASNTSTKEEAKVEKVDDKKVVEEKSMPSPKPPKLGMAPRADTESLSSSSSSSSSEDEEEEEEEEKAEKKEMEKKEEEEEEEEETESSTSEESSEEEEESEDEKEEEKKIEKAFEESQEDKKEEVAAAVPTKAEEKQEEDNDEESESGSESESESEDELITENYDSDLDKEAGDSSSEFKATHKYINQLKEQDDDGPGYIYVFTDSPRDATHHRVKVNASRFPEKRLEQARKFNLDMRTESAVPVRDRKAAVREVHNALEKYRMDHQRDWFYGLPEKIKTQVLKVCEKYVSEASDC